MDEAWITTLRTTLELGWPAIVLTMLVIVWRALVSRSQDMIDELRRQLQECKQEREILLGILLDKVKMISSEHQYSPAAHRFPRSSEMSSGLSDDGD